MFVCDVTESYAYDFVIKDFVIKKGHGIICAGLIFFLKEPSIFRQTTKFIIFVIAMAILPGFL